MLGHARRFGIVVGLAIFAGCSAHSGVGSASNSVVRPFALQSNAPSPSPWQQEPIIGFSNMAVGADGRSMWGSGGSGITRLDIATNTTTSFGGSWQAATAGPNGLMWYCDANDGDLHTIDDNGNMQTFAENWEGCDAIEVGPDGNLWLSAADAVLGSFEAYKVTPLGQATEYVLPHGAGQALIGGLHDGNVWYPTFGAANFVSPYVAKVNASTGLITEYPLLYKHQYPELYVAIDSGHDGNFYIVDGENDKILRVSETGTLRVFHAKVPGPGHIVAQSVANAFTIFYGDFAGNLWGWTVKGHVFTDYGTEPFGHGVVPLQGPDMNVWTGAAVYLLRSLSTTPQSASITVGGSQPFTITETNCPVCVWSAVSSDPGVASVSPVLGGGFTVTGQSIGSATITVSDKRYNVVQVPISVN